MIPAEQRIEQVMADTGMERMQAINHLRQRDELARRPIGNRLSDSLIRMVEIKMEEAPAHWTDKERREWASNQIFGDAA